MKAGPQLDAMVAVAVMGWSKHTAVRYGERVVVAVPRPQDLYSWFTRSQTDPGQWEPTDKPITKTGAAKIPRFSGDIDASWPVVAKLRERFSRVEVISVDDVWVCMVEADSGKVMERYVAESEADTAPLAICMAALAAVGVQVPA